MLYVTESGLYEAIGGSRKALAKELMRMLLAALPGLRRNNQDAQLITELEARIAKLERGGAHLLLQPIAGITPRARTNMAIRKFVYRQTGGYSYPDAWRELYYQLYYRYSIDLKSRGRKRKCDPLDTATAEEMETIANLAENIFKENQ